MGEITFHSDDDENRTGGEGMVLESIFFAKKHQQQTKGCLKWSETMRVHMLLQIDRQPGRGRFIFNNNKRVKRAGDNSISV